MKKLLMFFTIFFFILTLVGAFYVLTSDGSLNAGFAIIPLVFCLACLNGYRTDEKIEKTHMSFRK